MKNRDLNLTILTEKQEIFDFINSMNPKDFVDIHQTRLKDYWISEPPVENLDFLFDELDLWDTISEKYREFYNTLGLDGACNWLGDFPKKYVEYEMGLGSLEDDDELNECYDLFNELYGSSWSSWGYTWFIVELLQAYNEDLFYEDLF